MTDNSEVSLADLVTYCDEFNASPKNRLVTNALTTHKMTEVLKNRAVTTKYNFVYSKKISTEGKCCNQRSSGRCWMFALCNCMRINLMKKYNLDDSFEISQAHLFFYDKLEKANFFLQNVIETLDMDTDSRMIEHLFKDPLCDGGQWDMLVNLVNKYGVCPKQAFPENFNATESRSMNWWLTYTLRNFGKELRKMHNASSGDLTASNLQDAKKAMIKEFHKFLCLFFGQPPTQFDWTFYDKKDKKFHAFRDLTPVSFYQDHIRGMFDVDSKISLINDPRNEYYKMYTVDRLGNVVGGKGICYFNVPIEDMKEYAKKTIDNDDPCWFGCDVGKYFARDIAVLDVNAFDYENAFDHKFEFNKEDRLRYGASLMTHAMTLTGYDEEPNQPNPAKWRIENSWGEKGTDKGYLMMTDAWFDQFMYQVVVDKSLIDDNSPIKDLVANASTTEPIVLPAWDPMGALAK